MDERDKKASFRKQSDQYKERFQFLLTVNNGEEENIICQRYFRVYKYNPESLHSLELNQTLRGIVNAIKEDLVVKSRVYMWYNRQDEPLKLTGFKNTLEPVDTDEEGNPAGAERVWEPPTYISYGEETKRVEERPAYGAITYKFSFLVDEKPVYEEIWDGSSYPKFVRNSVDLSNSDYFYRDTDPLRLPGRSYMIRHLNFDRPDLQKQTMNQLNEVLSDSWQVANGPYHKTFIGKDGNTSPYGKRYTLNYYDKDFINGFRKATMSKTIEYQKWIDGPSDKSVAYIDRYL